MKRRLLIIAIIWSIILSICHLNSSAAVYGNYIYTVTDGEATVMGIVNTSLSTVTIPSTLGGYPVTAIGDKALQGNIEIESITIPEGVTSIGEYAFDNCWNLKNINLPHSLKNIGKYAFSTCTTIEEICIPYSVSSIGSYAFYDCTKLKGISIPSSLTSIASGTFANCESLEYINIPTTVKEIGFYAFYYEYYYRRALEINYYGSEASFYGVTIDGGNDCFNVPGWYNYNVNSNTDGVFSYTIENNEATVISIKNTALNVSVPHTVGGCPVVCIGGTLNNIWEENAIRTVELPTTITTIGNNAFNGCNYLQNIVLPDSVTVIGSDAFYNCYGLKNITMSKNLTEIGIYAFAYCKNLQTIEIPSGVTTIQNGTFSNCYSLNTVTLPENLEYIKRNAFEECTLISIVNFNGTNEQWDNIVIGSGNDYLVNATINCLIKVTGITLNTNKLSLYIGDTITLNTTITPTNATNTEVKWETANASVATVSDGIVTAINTGTATITATTVDGNYTASCVISVNPKIVSVTGVSLNKNNISINIGDNESLTAIVLPTNATTQMVTWKSSNTSVATVSDGVVTAKKIGKADITVTTVDGSYIDTCEVEVGVDGLCGENLTWKLNADGVLTISGMGDMYNYSSDKTPWYTYYTYVKSIIIEDGVTSIGEQAFYDYNNIGSLITQVSISESVTTIEKMAFARCKTINEIIIPDSATTLGDSVFRECTELKNITIGSGVTNINDWMFWGDYKLENINVSENNKYYCDINGNLYSKDKTVLENYAVGKTDTTFVIPDGVVSLGYGAFHNCDNLNEITIPDTLTTIGESVFDNCSNIKTVIMGKGIKEISMFAFDYCKNIEDVYYNGTKENWNNIVIDETNEYLLSATVHYAEEITPTISLSEESISMSGITESCVLIVASYNDSKLIDIKSIPISKDVTMTIAETELNTSNADMIKGFLWQSIHNLKPLCDMQYVIIE